MSDTSDIIRNMQFSSASAASSTDVVVKGFGSGALQGILEAISKTNSVINELQSEVERLRANEDERNRREEEGSKNRKKDQVASLASQRRSRATEQAIRGELKKGNVFNKMLREGLMEALNGLTNFLKENLNKALKTQQDLAATMRKANLSHDEKNQIQDLAIQMKDVVATKFDGLNVSNEQIKDYISDLIAAGKDVTRMSQSELAGYIALRRRNTESEKAYELAKVASEESIRQITLAQGDNQIAGSITKTMSMLTANQRMAMGGTDKALAQVTDIVKQVEEQAGGVLSSDEVAQLAMTIFKKNNLNLLGQGALSEEEGNILAAGGSDSSGGNQIKDIKGFIDNLKDRSNVVTASVNALPSYIAALKEAEQNGHEVGKVLKTDNQIREANDTNTVEGKLPNLFENVFNSTLGKITGPLSNWVDEMFGGSTDIVSICGTGFKIVIGLLGSIVASKILGKPMSILQDGLGKVLPNIGGKLAGGFGKVLRFALNPMTLAVGAAAASVGYAAYKIYDAYERLNKPDEVKKDIAANNKEIAETESRLETARKYGTPEDIKKIEAKLASLKAKGESLKADLEQANEDAKSESEKNSDKYSKEQTEVMKGFIDEANLAQRIAIRARQAGDEETYKKEMARHAALMEQADKTREQMRIVDEESRGLLASTFNLSPETMLGWRKFKDSTSNFFTKSIPEFFTETIPNSLKTAGNWVWDKVSGAGKAIYGVFDEYVISPLKSAWAWLDENLFTPVSNFFSDIAKWFDENIITPIGGFFDTIGKFIDENFIQPVKGFFEFKWLPESVQKFLFDDDYSAADLAGDLAGAAIDKGKDLLNGAADAISSGVDFVKGLWPFANGGVVNRATPAVVGEAGKEAILPLEKPDMLLEVLNKLTDSERNDILKSLLSSKNFSFENLTNILANFVSKQQLPNINSITIDKIGSPVPGDDQATINKILKLAGPWQNIVYNKLLHGWKGNYKNAFKQRQKWYDEALSNASNQEGRELIRGTYAERALDWGVTQLGKPYILRSLGKIGYVCNELADAALRASGFDMKDFHIWGVSGTFDKLKTGKRSKIRKGARKGQLEEFPEFRIRADLTPETAVPGMLFFQTSPGKTEPGHIGLVYYGHQRLHSSGGSSDFTEAGFWRGWQTPCRGVTVNPFDSKSKYVFGELPGLFAQASGEFKLPDGINFGPRAAIAAENSAAKSSTKEESKPTDLFDNVDNIRHLFRGGGALSRMTSDAFLNQFVDRFISEFDFTDEANSLRNDYTSAVRAVRDSSSDEAKQAAAEFSIAAFKALSGKSSSQEVLAALNAVIKYLRDIASSPVNKKVIPSASRPVSTAY